MACAQLWTSAPLGGRCQTNWGKEASSIEAGTAASPLRTSAQQILQVALKSESLWVKLWWCVAVRCGCVGVCVFQSIKIYLSLTSGKLLQKLWRALWRETTFPRWMNRWTIQKHGASGQGCRGVESRRRLGEKSPGSADQMEATSSDYGVSLSPVHGPLFSHTPFLSVSCSCSSPLHKCP